MYKNLTSPISFSLLMFVSLPIVSTLIFESKSAAWAQSTPTIQDQKSQADNLLKRAKQNLGVSQNLEAFKDYQKALNIYQQLGDLQGKAESLNGMSTAYYNQDALERGLPVYFEDFGFTEGENYFNQALAIAKKIGNQKLEAESLTGLGRAVDRLSDSAKAIKYYDQALAISKKIGDRQSEGRILNYLGVAHRSRAYFQKVLDYHQQALAVSKNIGDRQLEASALKELCDLYHNYDSNYIDKPSLSKMEMQQQSLTYCQKSLDIFSQIKDIPTSIQILRFISSSYKDLISKEQVIKYYQKTLLIAQQTNNRYLQKHTFESIGDIYDELGQYQKALDFYQQALKFESPVLQPAIGNQNYGLYSLYKSIGRCYSNLKQYALSIDYYTRSLDIAKFYDKNNKDNVKSVAFTKNYLLYSLGEAYYAQGKYQQAIDNYQESLSIYKSERDLEMQGTILWALGSSYGALANYQQAIASFQESISIFKKLNLPSDLAILLSNLGNSYFAIEQYQKAIDAFRESLLLKKQLGDRKGELELLTNIDDAIKALEKQKTKP
ncbi:MAG: hypothetical protein DCF19_14845 [Pseudanabaena frigida]|uniref:Tetratricopeptide repeat protein n=1 Tax=Pseudanabaena frigida TaxID=945775 RepID=A0A2W4W4F7_9CYAN|nr:MAG: hypothetical protein DCF19_14845 [Pseudanabaena frigida]